MSFRKVLVRNMFCRCCKVLKKIYLYLIPLLIYTWFLKSQFVGWARDRINAGSEMFLAPPIENVLRGKAIETGIILSILNKNVSCRFKKGPWSNSSYHFAVKVKLLFLHQLTHNMTTDCSLFMEILSSEYLQNMLCTQIVVFVLTFRTILVHSMFCRWCKHLKKIYL